MIKKDILNIYKLIEAVEKDELKAAKLPSESYYLPGDLILIKDPTNSGARFPYARQGMTIWAYASGYVTINNSSFYIGLPSNDGKEPYIDFFGIEKVAGKTEPVSILGVSKNIKEIPLKRYTVYSKNVCYYLTKTENFLYAVLVFIDESTKVYMMNVAINLSNETKPITLSAFLNLLFKYDSGESVETKWFKKVTYKDDQFLYESPENLDRHTMIENYGVVKRVVSKEANKVLNTTSRIDYVGKRNESLRNAKSLYENNFSQAPQVTHFTDTAICGDLITFDVSPDEVVWTGYEIQKAHEKSTLHHIQDESLSVADFKRIYQKLVQTNAYQFGNFDINFKGILYPTINDDLINQFIKMVEYQVDFAALSSNSGSVFLGVRDVMQQLESSLIWQKDIAKHKILEVLSFIDPSGIAPRQYSIPPKGQHARMDLREFIDQGVWIIYTIYTYLATTEDYQFLDEICGYYERIGTGSAKLSKLSDSVLDHLVRVTDFLVSQIDDKTGCLKALYGDWNDALDGLGLIEGSKGYGTGVSVMASLQLYDALHKMIEILKSKSSHEEHIETYQKTITRLEEGILKYAIVEQNNERKVIHGWGHEYSYLVGSFNDSDHMNRDSLTSNAYFIISKMIEKKPDLKEDIIRAFRRLDSKYGLKTFEPYFKENKGFGRIINLPKGTAENAATYVHATLFGVLALYMMGEGEFANEQLYKILPLSHKMISTSPFVMSNSYSYNPESNMDGESMSDWYTGSANTLLKVIMRGLFGIHISLDKIKIEPSNVFPAKEASMTFDLDHKKISVVYQNQGLGHRVFKVNQVIVPSSMNELSHLKSIIIDKNLIIKDTTIEIID